MTLLATSWPSLANCAFAGLAILFAGFVFKQIRAERKIKALGIRAPMIKHYLPFGLDVIGHTIFDTMRNRDFESWQNLFATFEPTCRTVEASLLGDRWIFTEDPENIKAVLATQFEEYGKGARFHDDWEPFLGESIFTTDGAQWRLCRQLLRLQFMKERVSDLTMFENHFQILLSCIESRKSEESIDMNRMFLQFTLDTATEFLLGESIGSLQNPHDEFSKAFAEVQRVQNMITKSGPANVLISRSSYNSSLQIINAFVNPYIEQALSPSLKMRQTNSQQQYTFLHALAESTPDRKLLRDQIIAVLLAGRDTTAAALSWVFYELGRHPKVVEKLRREIFDMVGANNLPTYENLKSMKYLQNVLNETLRLYPSIPFNVRVSIRDTTLPKGGGPDGLLPVGVPKDTFIAYSALALQRRDGHNPSEFGNLDFEPDRWLGRAAAPWTYIPFNGGPRTCIGQQFALAEMGYVVTRLLQFFDKVEGVGMPDPLDITSNLKAEIVLQPRDGVPIKLHRA